MPNLIAELEQAPTGSRELDAEIHAALGKPVDWLKDTDSDFRILDTAVPFYTTSMDGAFTTMPEGWSLAGLWSHQNPLRRRWWGTDARRDSPYQLVHGARGAKTPPLAMCIAGLRAREKDNG